MSQLKRNEIIEIIEKGASLADEDISFLDLSHIDFKKCDLSGTTLTGSVLTGANLSGCNLTDSLMAEVSAEGANFRESKMDDVFFQRGIITKADFTAVTMIDASIFMMRCEEAIFDSAQMAGIKILRSKMVGASFKNADMENASLKGSDIQNCDFSGSKLTHCDMRQVLPQGARFEAARTEGVLFYGKKPWGEEADQRDWSNELIHFNGD